MISTVRELLYAHITLLAALGSIAASRGALLPLLPLAVVFAIGCVWSAVEASRET